MTAPGFRNTVGALAVGQLLTWAAFFYAFSSFVLPMQQALGWTQPQTMGAFTSGLAISALASYPVGAAIDRGRARLVFVVGALLGGAGFAVWSQAATLPMLYAAWALIGVAMAMTLYEPVFSEVTRRFPDRYRQAITVLTLVGGFASTLSFPAAAALIDGLGWRGALAAVGALLAFGVAPLHAWALAGAGSAQPPDRGHAGRDDEGVDSISRAPIARDPISRDPIPRASIARDPISRDPISRDPIPRAPIAGAPSTGDTGADRPRTGARRTGDSLTCQARSGTTLREAAIASPFWLLTAAFTCHAFVAAALWAHVMPAFAAKGLADADAIAVVVWFGPAQVAGRLAFLAAGARLSPHRLGTAVLVLLPASLALFAVADSIAALIAFAALFGISNGLTTIVRGNIVPAFFGMRQIGRISAAMSAAALLARAAAPLGAATMLLGLHSYENLGFALAAIGAVAAVSFWGAGRRRGAPTRGFR